MAQTYSDEVLIGNWTEGRLKKEYELKLFLRKRERGELLLQKSRKLFSNLLRERPLAISGVLIKFGCQAQVIASDMEAPRCATKSSSPVYGLALSSLVTEREVDYVENLFDGCGLTMSTILTPCCRNTFTIVSASNEDKTGQNLKYGEEFLLQTVDYSDKPGPLLYVGYVISGVPEPKNRTAIRLSARPHSGCRWKALPLYPKTSLEMMGSPVPQGERLILKNCVADLNLCVRQTNWVQSFFGPECGVTVATYLDLHKRITAENIFQLVSDIKKEKGP